VLNELITNAFRHGFPDSRHGALTIRLDRSNGHVRLQVTDDGIGVASTQMPGKVIGSGRSIVDALVKEELEGTVDFAVDLEGTHVTITFPVD
jgi:two-component sensor histidine kinase